MNHRIRVLGFMSLNHAAGARLPKKAFALLAFLALEGRVLRRYIAELLWAGKPDALNNLAKLRAEVTLVLGVDALVLQGDFLSLGRVNLDILEWRSASAAARWDLYQGELLHGFSLPEWQLGRGTELQDWLEEKRRFFSVQFVEAGLSLATDHLVYSKFEAALPFLSAVATHSSEPRELALRWWLLTLGVLGKTQVLRGALASGKRALALVGLEVSMQTVSAFDLALARDTKACLARIRLEFPSVLPHQVFGRESEWQRMEAAWKAGQVILISGASGVGKSHLALEFAKAKGSLWRFWGRPSDQFVPFAFHARNFGWIFEHYPELSVPDWVRLEMSRLIPNLGGLPAPMVTLEDKLRFFEAQAETFRLACQQLQFATMFIDDAQYSDDASAQAGVYLHSKILPYQDVFPRTIFAFRAGGFAPQIEQSLRAWVEQGIAIWIDLEPLSQEAVGQCLSAVSPKLEGLQTAIMNYSGGYPMLVLETARWVLEQGIFDASELYLPRYEGAFVVTKARLGRLPTQALMLLRLAAIMDGHFDLLAAQSVLGWSKSKLQSQVQILGQAHLLVAGQVAHDLILEVVLSSIPADALVSLHRLALQILELQGVSAAIRLLHAVAANDVLAVQNFQPQAKAEALTLGALP